MDFFRQLNKNVQQSFSILNEGILITNGILDIKNNHLPYLLQLSLLESRKRHGSKRCCLFDEYYQYEDSTDLDPTSPAHFQDSTPKSPFNKDEELKDKSGSIITTKDDRELTPVDGKVCILKENCLLRKITLSQYKESIEFIKNFLDTLQNVLSHSTAASRNLVETQATPVLYDISRLVDVLKFIKDCGSRLDTIFENKFDIYKLLLSIITSSLKQLNTIVQYPPSLLSLKQEDIEYDNCRIEELKYDSVLNDPDAGNYTDFDLIGSLTIIHMDDSEKQELDQYLSFIDSITQFSSNAKTLFHSLHICFEDHDPTCNELTYELLALLQKLFTYNDINWNISRKNSNILYLRKRFEYYSCNFYLCHNGICYDCGKQMKLPGRTNSECSIIYCDCFNAWSMNNINNPSDISGEVVGNDGTNIKLLLDIVRYIKESDVKTIVIELILQFFIHINSFESYFYLNGGINVILDILDNFYTDQFYLWHSSLSQIRNETISDQNAFIDGNDIKILTTFAPGTVDSLLIIHHMLQQNTLEQEKNIIQCVVKYAEVLLQIFTFYKCSFGTFESTSIVPQVLYLVLDTCIWLLIPNSSGMIVNYNSSTLEIIYRVSEVFNFDNEDVWKVMAGELLQLSIFSFIILLNNAKFGANFDSSILYKLSSFLTLLFWASGSLYTSYDEKSVLNTLLHPIPQNHPVYKYMFLELHKKESSFQIPDSESIKLLHELRLMTFNNVDTSAALHLTICLLDDLSLYVPDSLRKCILDSCAKLGIFESTLSGDLCKYVSLVYNDFLVVLGNEIDFPDDEKILDSYQNFIKMYVDILIALFLRNQVDSSNIKFAEGGPLYLILKALKLIVKIISTDYNPIFEHFILSFLKFLFFFVFSGREDLVFDYGPLLDLIFLDKTTSTLSNGILSIILSFLIAKDFIQINRKISLVIPKLARNINLLYSSKEVQSAEFLLMETDIIVPIDSLSLQFEDVYNRFLKEMGSMHVTNIISLLFWYRNDYFGFSFPPYIYKCITLFRIYLHSHVFDFITRKFLPDAFFTSAFLSDSEVRTMDALKSVQMREMQFSHEKIKRLEQQLRILSNFHHLSDLHFKQVNDRISFLEEENKILRLNVDKTTDNYIKENIALKTQLATNILKYQKLENKHNELLKYIGSLSQHNTKDNAKASYKLQKN
ncbi:conserved hypothetical protein [Theileria equi strain WA]|uniref:Uncharacterized protein n=1 Tax=Theileria equi strain WA TaxID=1537102 RepID=L1LEX4_THEEQ|nr:conserved hypothetical protein [Theileria equi strain WA]EKX73775.1 conserved hypothetical protein [Theileria equi strain WA]|eukprot:XP_004833227.1 conserved hypothetical protein [Theileria equi strain WA]